MHGVSGIITCNCDIKNLPFLRIYQDCVPILLAPGTQGSISNWNLFEEWYCSRCKGECGEIPLTDS